MALGLATPCLLPTLNARGEAKGEPEGPSSSPQALINGVQSESPEGLFLSLGKEGGLALGKGWKPFRRRLGVGERQDDQHPVVANVVPVPGPGMPVPGSLPEFIEPQ